QWPEIGAFARRRVGRADGIDPDTRAIPRRGELVVTAVAVAQPFAVGAGGGDAGIGIVVQEAELVPFTIEAVGQLDREDAAAFRRGAELGAEIAQVLRDPVIPLARREARAPRGVAVGADASHQAPRGRLADGHIRVAN